MSDFSKEYEPIDNIRCSLGAIECELDNIRNSINLLIKQYKKREEQTIKDAPELDNSVITLFKDIMTLDDIQIDQIVSYLVEHGQRDSRFRLGETIKYSPTEIGKILRNKFVIENGVNSISDQELIKRVKEMVKNFTFTDEKNEIILKNLIDRFEFKANEENKRNIGNIQACTCERNKSE